MYQVSFNSLLCFQRCASDNLYIAKLRKENNSVNTENMVMIIIAVCTLPYSLYQCIKFHLFIIYTLRDMLWTSLLLQKLGKESNSVITCDKVTVLALSLFSEYRLSMYRVSFNFLL